MNDETVLPIPPSMPSNADGSRQCTGHNKLGARCGRAAIPGGFVCSLHGGRAPNVMRVARERLMTLVDPAMAGLFKALKTDEACPVCKRTDDMGVVVKAATVVLDRAGFGPRSTVAVEQLDAAEKGWAKYLTDEQLEQVSAWVKEAKDRAAMNVIDITPKQLTA